MPADPAIPHNQGRIHTMRGHTAEYMERATEMVKLRSSGMTLGEIGSRYNVSVPTVSASIKAAIAVIPYEAVQEMRSLQLDALNLQKRRLLRVFLSDHPKVDHGKVIKRTLPDGTVETLMDYDITIRASSELRRIEDSISRLTGTRAPVVHEVREITEDALDAEIRQLTTSLRLRAAQLGEVIDVPSYPELPPGEDAAATAVASPGEGTP